MEPRKVLGIVLSATPISEYDKRVVLLTKELGKLSAFARNARKPHSPLIGATIPFTFGEFTILEGRTSVNIISAESKNHFPSLHSDLDRACYGMYFLELADYFSREYNDERAMLKLLYQTLRALESGRFGNDFIKAVYEWKMLVINGTYPDMSGSEFRERFKLNKSSEYTLQFIIDIPVEKLYTFNVERYVLDELKAVVSFYLNRYVDRKLNSLKMIENISGLS